MASTSKKTKRKAPSFFTEETAESLVRNEEHRLLIRNGQCGLSSKNKNRAVRAVLLCDGIESGVNAIAEIIKG